MKRLRIISIIILLSNWSFGQDDQVENIHSLKVTYIGISYAYEQRIAKNSIVNFEFTLGAGYQSNVFGNNYWFVSPILRVEPRYYYNYQKRIIKGKKTDNNSADYLSFSVDYQFAKSDWHYPNFFWVLSFVPKWGLKRTLWNHFIFEFAGGVGAYVSENKFWKPAVGLDLKFGYSF